MPVKKKVAPVKRKPVKPSAAPKKVKPKIDFADLVERPPATAKQLAQVINLARQMYKLEKELTALEEKLAAKNKELVRVAEEDLPEAMAQAGIEGYTLEGGYKLERKRTIFAGIPKDEEIRAKAFAWLKANEHDDLIKKLVTLTFGKGEEELAAAALKFLRGRKYAAARLTETDSVHGSTLKAFVTEQVDAGEALPMDLLGVHVLNRAYITPPKGAVNANEPNLD